MQYERKDLGTYKTAAAHVGAELALQADFSDGHIDPTHGTYYTQWRFWSDVDGASAEIGYCARGFKEVFEKLKPLTQGIDAIVKQQMMPPSQLNSGLVDKCVESLKEQTKLIAEIKELPIGRTHPSH